MNQWKIVWLPVWMNLMLLLEVVLSLVRVYRSIHSVIIKLYCACQRHSKSLSSELATGVRNWRQIMVFDFDPLGSNRKCNGNKLICIFKTNTLFISLCTINFAISISNDGSSHRREPYPEPATLVYILSNYNPGKWPIVFCFRSWSIFCVWLRCVSELMISRFLCTLLLFNGRILLFEYAMITIWSSGLIFKCFTVINL